MSFNTTMSKSLFSRIAVFGLFVLAWTPSDAQVVQVGQGSYTTVFPGVDAAGRNSFPSGTPFVTGPAANKPVPTNEWWSHKVKNAHSSNLFNYPFTMETNNQGLVATYVPWGPIDAFDPVEVGVVGLNASSVKVADYDDWTFTMDWQSGNHHFQAKTGIGMPFIYFEKDVMSLAQVVVNQGTVTDSGSYLIVKGVNQGADFAIYGPSGSTWSQNGNTYTSTLNGNTYWSLAFLPIGGNADVLAHSFKQYAFVFPEECRANWSFDEQSSVVTTTFDVQTEVKEGTDSLFLQGLLPHHWANLAPGSSVNTSHEYRTVRGDLKLMEGNSFTVENTFYGILPTLPNVNCRSLTYDPAKLKEKIDLIKGDQLATWTDSYNEGQVMNRLIQTARIADQMGDTASLNTVVATIKERLEDWLKFNSGEVAFLFYYNDDWDALIGYPAGHGQDNNINDHHFHWGYFIHAAAFLEQYEPGWANGYGPMINMLVRDAATDDRQDPLFPYLRNFSPYAGHCWANGFASFPQGNDQESTSESMQFNSSLIHWGSVTGNDSIRDLGIYLYTTEQSAIEEYWFDMHQRNFGPSQQYGLVSRVWGNSYDNGTFWTSDIAASYGIELYPIHGGSMYLGHNLSYAAQIWSEIEQHTGILNNAPNVNLWHDIMWQYLAFTDPDQALSLYDSYPDRNLKFGVSDAQTYYWLHGMKVLGAPDTTIKADYPVAVAFQGDGSPIYVAHNYGTTSLDITFSDGYVLTVPPGKLVSSLDAGLEGNLSILFDRAYTGGTAELEFQVQQGSPSMVVLYQGEDSVAFSTTPPYDFTVNNLPAGVHNFHVRMYDSLNCATSNIVSMTVGEQVPYQGVPANIPGSFWAGDYDYFEGGIAQGIAYQDLDIVNQGDYRVHEWVDASDHPSEGPVIGWLGAGEWLEYTVDVQTAGMYDVALRYASGNNAGGGPLRIESDGQVVKNNITFSGTGDWNAWASKTVTSVPMKSGKQIIRLFIEHGEFNLGELQFTLTGSLPYSQPVADAGPTQVIVVPANSSTLDASASTDPWGSALNYTWTQLYGPTLATPSQINGVTPQITGLQEGVYKYKLEVDNGTYSDIDEVFVVVGNSPNVPPTTSILFPGDGDSFVEGENLMISATASDLNDSISHVDFYLNGQFYSSSSSIPYEASWTASLGSTEWRSLAYDHLGDSTWSAPVVLQIDSAPPCDGVSYNGDFEWRFSDDDNNPTLTFIPSQTGVGVPTCILYYGTDPNGMPGYGVTPNVPFTISASKGELIYFYYTYSYPGEGERNNSANKDTYVIGTCVEAISLEEYTASTIDIYPNPSRGRFTVRRESQVPAAFRVQNLSGQVLMQGVLESDHVELNLERLPAGMYILNVNQEGQQSSYKLVLMH